MAAWDSLIRFRASDAREYWAALPLETDPAAGLTVQGFSSVESLESGSGGSQVTVDKVGQYQSPARETVSTGTMLTSSAADSFLLPSQ